jgi:hypothetical protein
MPNNNTDKENTAVFVIRMLLIFVFVYAAYSKLTDLEAFARQISLSPLIPAALTRPAALLVPVAEIMISIFLGFNTTCRLGLYAGYFLMLLFTLYIFFLMNYSSFIPCSCGGILGELSWKSHMAFNCSLLALTAIACYKAEQQVFSAAGNDHLQPLSHESR